MDAASGQLKDRRLVWRSQTPAEHGIVSARVKPGHDATIVNVSAAGALIETAHRLLPAARVELYLQTSQSRAAVWGRVLRACVSVVGADGVRYRGAIGFDHVLPWTIGQAGSGSDVPVHGGHR